MLNKDDAKTVIRVATDVLELVGLYIGVRWLFSKKVVNKPVVTHSDAISAILYSSMLASDKAVAAGKLRIDQEPEFYEAIIKIVQSSMLSSDRLKVILELCEKMEEA